MPQRGKRSIWPAKPRKPTGIFSTSGRQKNDGNGGAPALGAKDYAHSRKCRTNGVKKKLSLPSGGKSLRHQPPKRRK